MTNMKVVSESVDLPLNPIKTTYKDKACKRR